MRDVPVKPDARRRLEHLLRLRDLLNLKIAEAALELERNRDEPAGRTS